MEKKRDRILGEQTTHESFGMLRFSRIQGWSGNLFGSDLQSQNYVMMELSNGCLHRDLSHEFYTDKGVPLVRVKMSANQFAELITSLNYGAGTPCTVEYFNGERVPQVETIETKRTAHQRQFSEEMNERSGKFDKDVSDILELLEKKSIGKADKERIISSLRSVQSTLRSSIPFYLKTFEENMDKVVLEAKTEIENAIQAKITNAGMEKLGLESPQLKEIKE